MDSSTGYESFRAATAPQNSGAIPQEQTARGRRQNLSEPRMPHRDVSYKRAAEDPGQRPPKDSDLSNSSFPPNSNPKPTKAQNMPFPSTYGISLFRLREVK